MSYSVKLLIAAAFGLAAAMINWFVLSAGTARESYVTVTKPLKEGDAIDLAQVEPLPLPKGLTNLSRTMVPFADRGVLSGRIVRRDINVGDPVFFADTDLGGQWFDLQRGEKLFPMSLDGAKADRTLLRIGNLITLLVRATAGNEKVTKLGPFRIVVVDGSASNNLDRASRAGNGQLKVTIAYDAEKDAEKFKDLLEFIAQRENNEAMLLGAEITDQR